MAAAPQVATPGLFEVRVQINSSSSSGFSYNIFHGQASGSMLTAANAMIAALAAFYGAIKVNYVAGATITCGVSCIDRSQVPWQFIPATPSVVNSTGTGVVAAPQLAACVTWRSNQVGKSYRGRTYIGPLSQSAINGPTLNAALLTPLTSAAATLISAGATGSSYSPGIYSAKHNTIAAIISSAVTNATRTMRSRAA